MNQTPSNRLSVPLCLGQMTQWLKAREPFFHTRYNDGEWKSMFKLRRETQRCPRHKYSREIGLALLETHNEIIGGILAGWKNILLGSNWRIATGEDADAYDTYIKGHPKLLERTCWVPGDSWYTTAEEISEDVDDKGLLHLLDEVREGSHNSVLVGNSQIALARHCLGAQWVDIPSKDGWEVHWKILEDCLQVGNPTSTYVWCAGFPGKVISWKIWRKWPETSHIDLGSLFDCVFRVGIAAWMLRRGDDPHQAHRKFIEQTIEPYVRSFIPEGAAR